MISIMTSVGCEWVGKMNREGIWTPAGMRPSEYKEGEAGSCPPEESHPILGSGGISQLWNYQIDNCPYLHPQGSP